MKFNKYALMLGLAAMSLTTACDDQSDEITSIEYDRLFAPFGLEAKTTNRTNAKISWTRTEGATSYVLQVFENDSLTCVGEPVKIDTLGEGNSYLLKGLLGDTKYTVRLKAMSETKAESKWSQGAYFKTDGENIFLAPEADDITATSVILRWADESGKGVEKVTLAHGEEVTEYVVESDENAAGMKKIEGLTGETKYKATLILGDKTRGTYTFETLIDLGGAIAVDPSMDLKAMLEGATAGSVFALYPGTYTIEAGEGATGAGRVQLTQSVEIKAVRPNDRPIINGCIALNNGASLALKQVVMDGTGTDGGQAFDFKTDAATYDHLTLEDCEVKNYSKGFFYINVAATVNAISIDNCLIHDIVCDGGDMFDCRKGAYFVFNLNNTTIYNSCAARDFVRYDDASASFPGVIPMISIQNCTLDGVANTDGKRIFYVRFGGKGDKQVLNFKNNIVTNTLANFTDQSSTAEPTFAGNVNFNTPNLQEATKVTSKVVLYFDNAAKMMDPQYKDAANGDFTVGNEDVEVGASRWLVK